MNRSRERDRVDATRYAGGARAEFIATARRAVRECDEGRAASACIRDVRDALARLDARLPANQSGRRP